MTNKSFSEISLPSGTLAQRPLKFVTSEYERCKSHPIYFIKKYCELPIPHEWQLTAIYSFAHTWTEQRNVLMALPRTSGKTQTICGLALHTLVFGTEQTVVIGTVHGNMGNRILETIKHYYDLLPEEFKSFELRRNENGWTFGTNTVRVCLNHQHILGHDLPTVLMLDEPGLMERDLYQKFMALPSPRRIMLGTPHGRNHFYDAFLQNQRHHRRPIWHKWLVMQVSATDIENYKIPPVARQIQPTAVFNQQYLASFDPCI